MSISLTFKLEQKVYVSIQKCLHLNHSASSLCFYSFVSSCPLPIKSLSSALKASNISGNLLLRSSRDLLVSGCIPKLQTGIWKVEDAVSSGENDIKINQVCGNSHHNMHGLGYTTKPMSSPSCPTAGAGSVDKMDELYSARLFLGLFDVYAS